MDNTEYSDKNRKRGIRRDISKRIKSRIESDIKADYRVRRSYWAVQYWRRRNHETVTTEKVRATYAWQYIGYRNEADHIDALWCKERNRHLRNEGKSRQRHGIDDWDLGNWLHYVRKNDIRMDQEAKEFWQYGSIRDVISYYEDPEDFFYCGCDDCRADWGPWISGE